ncbi:MAG: hypothetical protein LBQ84_02565 [Flavobacteriaceae bacterium]|jgi:hypothetical protein|nr:hypothetical protein [Flavobacteriaceae bacterium]
MKKLVVFFFILFPVAASAQSFGIGSQHVKKEKLQLSINSYMPFYQINSVSSPVVVGLGSGFDYLSPGFKVSGLNVKPVSLFLMNNSSSPFTFGVKFDAGYNFGFGRGNGVALTPSLYADASVYYISAGYDYNTHHDTGQFFVRIGVGLTLGFLKDLINR